MPIGYSAVLLPQLSATNNIPTNSTPEIIIDIEMGSWIGKISLNIQKMTKKVLNLLIIFYL